jgi:4-aminobutyrate aminotransferase / (S)-3-amino-2-methylpropionate transaminase / 5-aminovalerate transaminase
VRAGSSSRRPDSSPRSRAGPTSRAREQGVLFVADEIQTGFCRTGDWFASTFEEVEPDLITTAKGIAGGLPLAGVTGRAEIMDSVHVGGLGGTYGGNPIACAAALAAIETMRTLDLAGAASMIGDVFTARLTALAHEFPQLAEVRGRGAMIAVELVRPGTLTPDPALTAAVNRACHASGLLTLTCGTWSNVFHFLPPLVISPEHLDRSLTLFEQALRNSAS